MAEVNFPEMERKLLAYWEKEGIVEKYLAKNKNSEKHFSFLDGPITANNPMGVHHAWGRMYKDLWPRFYSMRGYKQRHQNGFDCQGLWVEVEVEKELGFKNKKDIEQFGVEKFVNLCKDRVKKYSDIQTEQSKRLGYFADWDHSYYTLSDDNNYMIWHFLKVCHDNGWLYKGNDSVPWCPRCETAISQHEMLTEDYKEITHETIFMKFPIVGTDENLLVWTTTPWTIPANIAVAVDKKLDYVLVEVGGNKYWLADGARERVLKGTDFKEIKKVKGQELVGLKYTGAFDDLPAVSEVGQKNPQSFHTVIATNNLIMPITTTEGTGLVHTAVSAGTEDFKLGKELELPMIPVINDDASYLPGLGFLSGLNAKKNPRLILDYMDKKSFAFRIEKYTHRYPACWRCKTELVWKVTDEWYISMDVPSKIRNSKSEIRNKTLRERMIEVTKKIKWLPEFGLDRELDWLANMHDWLISKKNRYWGLALPIWECECGHFEVIGSKEELKEKTVSGWDQFEGKSPHKPQIDSVKIKCSQCGEAAFRIEPVGNPWLDAGIVPFSTISKDNQSAPLYLSDKKEWLKWYPADFITESFPGQFKNWFYSMIAMSTVLEDQAPMKTVLGFGTMTDELGRPFHKSAGNALEFIEAADKFGADVIRWVCCRTDPANNILFGENLANETRRQFHLMLWNIYNFYTTYASIDGFDPSRHPRESGDPDWIPDQVGNDRRSALDEWILERLNQTTVEVTSHLEAYSAYLASGAIEDFVNDLSLWYIRRSRGRVGPSAENKEDKEAFYQTTYHVLTTLCQLLAPFTPFISEEIYLKLTTNESVHLTNWPHSVKTSRGKPSLVTAMAKGRKIAEVIHAKRKEQNVAVKVPLLKVTLPESYRVDDSAVLVIVADEVNAREIVFGKVKAIELDMTQTPEMEEEIKTRELVRKIQNERKVLGLNLSQTIKVVTDWQPVDPKNLDLLVKKTQIAHLSQGPELKVTLSEK